MNFLLVSEGHHPAGCVHGIAEQAISWHFVAYNARHDAASMGAQTDLDVGQFIALKLGARVLHEGHAVPHV